ncbi:splicing regulatory glutamine/lysine-rich protein 1 [Drosophila erecta]|uniref:splicing regulatory glutamine/lysine-rich protein 1 n=1 Tax=Drosophila erecta TaxID=7220 RepID=UPI00017801F2|nr:splicing regulatory glutamine/lysine-rich protein 1 [Drosophila erecta]
MLIRTARKNRKKSYDMEDSESQKPEKNPSPARKEDRKEDRKERRKEQEMERKREVERRKEIAREKEQEKQNQQKWHKELEKERQREKELQRDHLRQEASTSSKRVNAEITKFDDEFERDIEKLERSICQLDFRSKTMATMWMDKLRQPPHNAAEARSRNIIASHLLKCCGDNIFKMEPFNHPPPPQNLTSIREKMYLTRDSTCHGMPIARPKEPNANLTQLFSDSYDGGAFLRQLPVPRDGAFFIYHMQPNL